MLSRRLQQLGRERGALLPMLSLDAGGAGDADPSRYQKSMEKSKPLAEINEELQLALQLVGAMRVKDLGALTARVCPHAPACMGGVDAGIY